MSEEKSHEHSEHSHEHSHAKSEEGYFKVSKLRLWQGISAILAIMVIFLLWFNPGLGVKQGTANNAQPTVAAAQNVPTQAQPAARLDKVDEGSNPPLGKKGAPVTIVEFGDYQCPFCQRAFQQTFPQIKKDYVDTGKARYVFVNFPLSFHPNAEPAAEASECANEQGKFWEYHDKLYENQATLGNDLYPKLANDLKLDAAKFKQCLDSGKYKQQVQKDLDYGQSVGVSGTPSFFINGMRIVGAQPYEAFKQAIDAELAN